MIVYTFVDSLVVGLLNKFGLTTVIVTDWSQICLVAGVTYFMWDCYIE